jgi:hypothetical protein
MESLCDTFDEASASASSKEDDLELRKQNPFQLALDSRDIKAESKCDPMITDEQQTTGNVSGNTLPSEF